MLDWLHYVARTSLASCHSHGVMEKREAFKAALAAEDTEVPRHPSQVSLLHKTLRSEAGSCSTGRIDGLNAGLL